MRVTQLVFSFSFLLLACGPLSTTAEMQPRGNAGQAGRAVITSEDSKTNIQLHVDAQPPEVWQPAFLQQGRCGAPGAVLETLNEVSVGASNTSVNLNYGAVRGNCITVRASREDPNTIVSCGDVL
jgi:hypothetical protein